MHLVCMHDLTDPPRHEPHRSCEPQEIISNPNDPLISQHRKKSLLHRRQWHERPIQIKKRCYTSVFLLYFPFLLRHHHNAPCAILFTPRTWPTPETKRHPSANTGNPRNKQNAAVIHVSTWAPTRTNPRASAVIPPSSRTGPRASANSRPRQQKHRHFI